MSSSFGSVGWSAVALVLLTASCTSSRAAADPFAAGPRRGERPREYSVRLEVVCDQCLVRYQFGPQQASAEVGRRDPIWTRRLRRFPLQREAIRLTASTGTRGGALNRIAIYVDGEVVAADECSSCGGGVEGLGEVHTLSVETEIGPR